MKCIWRIDTIASSDIRWQFDTMTKAPFRSDQQDKFMLRLPDGMRELIKDAAESAGRSMNAEIVQRLEASFLHNTLEEWHATHLAIRNDQLAEQRRDAVALSNLTDDLADQIAERIIAEMRGMERPAWRPAGTVAVTTKRK